jgi:hypothetical protein
MRRALAVAATLLALPAFAQVQEGEKPFRYKGNSYVSFGVGRCQHGYSNISVGGGGEAFLVGGLSVGGEAAYHQFLNSFSFGLATGNVGYHFVKRSEAKRIDPFASLGLGVGITGDPAPGASLGGGVIYWFKPKFGVRTEFRIYSVSEEIIPTFRVGFSFR